MKKLALTLALLCAACSGGSSGSSSSSSSSGSTSSGSTTGSGGTSSTSGSSTGSGSGSGGTTGTCTVQGSGSTGSVPPLNPSITLPCGFHGNTIAQIGGARELVALPNGDLLVGTSSSNVYIVPNAEAEGAAGAAAVFTQLSDSPAQGVALGPNDAIYVATEHGVWKLPYHVGDRSVLGSSAVRIAQVRTGAIAPNSDGDVHHTSSVAVSGTTVYVGVGSSCNACTEVDPTRATIQKMGLDGQNMTTLATRLRNAIALTLNPATGTLWAGGAGQDNLPTGHPFEFMDPVTLHGSNLPIDYGWPECEENHVAYTAGASCANTVVPALEFPANATHIGAVFYPANQGGTYKFPSAYLGGLFVTNHGSWHTGPATPPSVAFVPMSGDAPQSPVSWSNPKAQWSVFMGGMGTEAARSDREYTARPTGIAVGTQGSLFVADDKNGAIYRIRPNR